MAIKDRNALRTQFRNRKKPDEDDFADIFDSSLNKIDDQIVVDNKNNIGIGHAQGSLFNAKLDIDGKLNVSEGCIVGKDLEVGGSVDINNELGFLQPGSTKVDEISTDTDMGQYNASDRKLATQKAIKAYVDTRIIEGVNLGISLAFVGSITAFARKNIADNAPNGNPPDGWLICDGRAYNIGEYPELFEVLETHYGNGDASGGQFNVPDLRGIFIRGMDIDGSTGNDPNSGSRTHPSGGPNNNMIGGYQADVFKQHSHNFTYNRSNINENEPASWLSSWGKGIGGKKYFWRTLISKSTASRGSTETRPKNAIYMYCIKY